MICHTHNSDLTDDELNVILDEDLNRAPEVGLDSVLVPFPGGNIAGLRNSTLIKILLYCYPFVIYK